VRRVLPTSIAEPIEVGVRSGLRTAGLLDPAENGAAPALAAPAPSPAATIQKPVVFFHVMKCGGTSVRDGLSAGITGARKGPEVFELDGEAAKLSAGGRDPDNWKFRDALLPYVLRTTRPRVVLGHFRYRDGYRELLDGAHFVTVLRDPCERMVSLYKYRLYKEGVDVPVTGGFDEFIRSSRWAKEGHAYVTTFCGGTDMDPRSDAAVAAAVANLGRFAVVGFTEALDDFSRRVGVCAGTPVSIPVLNASPAPRTRLDREIADAADRLREICAPDLQVYERVRTMLAQP
jgi:hypothetical protein